MQHKLLHAVLHRRQQQQALLLSTVCKSWLHVFRTIETLFSCVSFRGLGHVANDALVAPPVSLYASMIDTLDFGDCMMITDETVAVVGRSCPALRSLSLNSCIKITSAALGIIGEQCTRLTFLDIGYAPTPRARAPAATTATLPSIHPCS
jgi:hypothetical protein